MAIGFSNRFDFKPIVGWELYQVIIDKYHVVFEFQNGHGALDIADRFSFRSYDGSVEYIYEIYGESKMLNVDRILRVRVADVLVFSKDRLDLSFENGDVLSIYDNPRFRSWGFGGGFEGEPQADCNDVEIDDLSDLELAERQR